MVGERGENLIIIFSQPRSGSTLLQRIFASSPDIHSTQETWIALYPLYGLKTPTFNAAYGAEAAWYASRSFLSGLPEGKHEQIISIRLMLTYLYNRALAPSNKRYFLDKCTRYHLVIPEFLKVFPEAKFLILFRNPLAVLSSILINWVRREWLGASYAKIDLLDGPINLIAGKELLGRRGVLVNYESLVLNPEETLQNICHNLDIPFSQRMIAYGRSNLPKWEIGDQKNLYHYSSPNPKLKNQWIGKLKDPQIWNLSNDYLHYLGRQNLAKMGYSFEENQKILEDYRPNIVKRNIHFSLQWLLKSEPVDRSWLELRLFGFHQKLFRD